MANDRVSRRELATLAREVINAEHAVARVARRPFAPNGQLDDAQGRLRIAETGFASAKDVVSAHQVVAWLRPSRRRRREEYF